MVAWPFKSEERLSESEMRRLQKQAERELVEREEKRLAEMVGSRWHSASSGAVRGGEGTYRKGVGAVLQEQQRGCGDRLQGLGLTIRYAVRVGALTAEQASTFDLTRPVPEAVQEQREADAEREREWEREFKQVQTSLSARAEKAGVSPYLAGQHALELWNREPSHRKYDAQSLSSWRAKCERWLKVESGEEPVRREPDQSWRETFGQQQRSA